MRTGHHEFEQFIKQANEIERNSVIAHPLPAVAALATTAWAVTVIAVYVAKSGVLARLKKQVKLLHDE